MYGPWGEWISLPKDSKTKYETKALGGLSVSKHTEERRSKNGRPRNTETKTRRTLILQRSQQGGINGEKIEWSREWLARNH